MLAFIFNVLIVAGVMWLFFRFMYPKPPKAFFAQAGDDVSIRHCDYCQSTLASYRGIFIPKSLPANTAEKDVVSSQLVRDDKHTVCEDGYFFCNQAHQIYYCQAQGLAVDNLMQDLEKTKPSAK